MGRRSSSEHSPKRGGGGNGFLFLATVIIAVVAVKRELRTPAAERQWHGTVDVPVPYEFRTPTLERLTRSVWAPDEERLFVPMAFGVGWSLNLARLLRRGS